jgi:hypothetical protein
MDGLQIKGEGSPPHAPVPNDWHIEGTGDFNGDGNSDILWRHDSGQLYALSLQQKQSAPTRSALLPKRRRNCPRQRFINAALPLCAPCPLSRDKANAHERPNAIHHGRFRPRTDCWDHVADRGRS